ncbi:MAG: polynucleotide adenylyltransferase PcnB, partial [Pseudomonadota bacterium]|nr:polynucleotide adenylyltransferase PcnB [Pseudomonadota bacterium]
MKKVWRSIKKSMSSPSKGARTVPVSVNAVVIPRDAHPISRRDISPAAVKVLNRLDQAGYAAFLVGGGVRDLLLGMHPKDFDVTTDATPEQIRKLFSNSMIIGRRFRLVHVRYGREIVEVATFRGAGGDTDKPVHEKAKSGILLNDNVWGSMEEDAFRRDFTVNALFYNIADFSVVDYCHGMRDLEAKQICVIGDPVVRYREDPVRMLRAVRLSAKLGFTIEQASAKPIAEMANLLSHVSPARLFDEFVKMLVGGKAEATFASLQRYDLFGHLFSQAANIVQDERAGYASALIKAALRETDNRVNADKSIN